ncbi:MAG: hypothetical protein E7558_04525 [Ruminococcaceae bacterium]|nr:hypothetical protein [Oscillospiraceae bacterium]
MTRTSVDILDYYNTAVVDMITVKYGMTAEAAFRSFVKSEIHGMLTDSKYEMWQFGAQAIFDMWENEKITGDPRNSTYLRGDLQ